MLGFKKLSDIYQSLRDNKSPQKFIKDVLEHLDIKYIVNPVHTKTDIPETGSLLIIANHPFGALDALLLLDYLSENRPDIRIMANVFLERITPVSELILGVNPFKDKVAIKSNLKKMREIHQWLQDGHCLITFPAGNVSQIHLKKPFIADGNWNQQIARLARSTKTSVLPITVKGRNSPWFYMLGPHLHALRYGLELLNKKGKTINLYQGEIMNQETIKAIQSDVDLISWFRKKVMEKV